jgi:nucleotide-binding universal stress UspA family protein
VDVDCSLSVSQEAARSIVAHAYGRRATFVAVGPTGASQWQKLTLGSVTERVLRDAPLSVLVVRAAPPVRHVIAALDRTPHSGRALQAALAIARGLRAKLTAIHAVETPETMLFAGGLAVPSYASRSALRADELEEFRAWVREFPDRGVLVDVVVSEGSPAQVVARAADAAEGALVVVGAGVHGRAHRVFVGSVARSIAMTCPASVLVVRGGRAAARAARRDRVAAAAT